MRRHPTLVPLSHHHHRALVVARTLRQATDSSPADRLAVARGFVEFVDRHGAAHFRAEEEQFFPLLVEEDGTTPPELARALLEHARLRALTTTIAAAAEEASVDGALLDRTGTLLDAHVRLEERLLFPLLEQRAQAELDRRASALADAVPSGSVVELLEIRSGRGAIWGLDTPDLNATLVEWPPGQGVEEHVLEGRDVLLVVVAGSVRVQVDGGPHDVGQHELLLVPAGTRRSIAAGPAGARYLSVHRRRGPLLPTPIGRPGRPPVG